MSFGDVCTLNVPYVLIISLLNVTFGYSIVVDLKLWHLARACLDVPDEFPRSSLLDLRHLKCNYLGLLGCIRLSFSDVT
jgi:hypothetical protein